MMSFVRTGPKILIIDTSDEATFKKFVKTHFSCKEMGEGVKTFEDVISVMTQHQTLIYFTQDKRNDISHFEIEHCVVMDEEAHSFLIYSINHGMANLINHVSKAPRIVIMKVLGATESIINSVAEDFVSEIEPVKTIFSRHLQGTAICFTGVNLNKRVNFEDFFHQAIYTEAHYSDVIKIIDSHSLKYINRNMNMDDWYEITIRIHDKYEAYKMQSDRLNFVLDKLNAGFILKEGWGEDSLKLFVSSGAYKVTLYTYLKPVELYNILIALEYMENGEHLVDFDMIYNKKKVHWDESSGAGKKGREQLSLEYRRKIYEELDIEDIKTLEAMEDSIFSSR